MKPPIVQSLPSVPLEVQLDRDRDARTQQRRALWRNRMERLEPVLFAVGLAVMISVLGPSLDDESSIAVAMGMIVR